MKDTSSYRAKAITATKTIAITGRALVVAAESNSATSATTGSAISSASATMVVSSSISDRLAL